MDNNLVGKITHYQLFIAYKNAGMAEQADALDLGSRNWGFDSLFPYFFSNKNLWNKKIKVIFILRKLIAHYRFYFASSIRNNTKI